MQHPDSSIIDGFGGNRALMKVFNVTSQCVSKWRREGIPDARRFSMQLMRPDLFTQVSTPAAPPRTGKRAGGLPSEVQP